MKEYVILCMYIQEINTNQNNAQARSQSFLKGGSKIKGDTAEKSC